MKGFSRSNLFYMRGFAAGWPDPIVQQPVGQLPWGQITVLLDKLDTSADRDWYTAATVQHGWSRNVLMNLIVNNTMQRTGAAPSHFDLHLSAPDSELAIQIAKDPYNFEFLGLTGRVIWIVLRHHFIENHQCPASSFHRDGAGSWVS